MNTEPIALNTAIKEALSSLLKVIVIFGVIQMTTEQFGALMIAVDAVLAAIFLIWNARRQSTPINSPRVPEGTTVDVYNPETGNTTSSTTLPAG